MPFKKAKEHKMTLDIGDAAPGFTLPTDNQDDITLARLRGGNVVVYFYPKDMTPGCTIQANEFSASAADFAAANTKIIGISKDSVKRHARFRKKHNLNIILAADEQGVALDAYGVWGHKKLYGRTFLGIERTTFLVDREGLIRAVWRKVKVKDHVAAVLEAAQAL
jgi:thioredoxin-dependent peroxiredoxin